MKKIKICAYTIALNEEKHVMRWLEGTRDADVRVVVDKQHQMLLFTKYQLNLLGLMMHVTQLLL
jgi:hypothetical protein